MVKLGSLSPQHRRGARGVGSDPPLCLKISHIYTNPLFRFSVTPRSIFYIFVEQSIRSHLSMGVGFAVVCARRCVRKRKRGRMSGGPLRNRQGGLGVPKEVSRNGVILPPIGEVLEGSTPVVVRGSEAGRTGRHQHNGTTKKIRHDSSTPAVAAADAADVQNVQGVSCEAEGNSPGGTSTSTGGTNIICSAKATTPTTSLHDDDVHRDAADDLGVTTTEGNGQQGHFLNPDDDRGGGATEHENCFAADAKDATNNGLADTETKEEKETIVNDLSGGIVVETSEGTHAAPNVPRGAQTPKNGPGERGRGPISPVAAIRARVDDALRNLLALGSEAQASPASASPPRTTTSGSRRPDQLSPLSWGRLKPGRRTKESAFFCGSQDKGLDNRDSGNIGPAANGCLPNATSGNVVVPTIDDDNATHNRREDGQPGGIEATTSSGLVIGNEAVSGGCQKIVSETDETSHHTGSVGHHKVATGGEGIVPEEKVTASAAENHRRILARENTLIPRDVWPELLDNEADPREWSLDKGEGEVLAAARRMGSVLVRVVTWNLHAKPTPAADKLRESLLPPGKVIEY